eukprot:7233494-Alexandrium_andersonii.AAC.1
MRVAVRRAGDCTAKGVFVGLRTAGAFLAFSIVARLSFERGQREQRAFCPARLRLAASCSHPIAVVALAF